MSKFKPNYQITIISGCGLAGIIVALFLLSLHKSKDAGSVFHEVGYFPGDVVNQAIRHFTDSLHNTLDTATDHKLIEEDSAAIVALNQDRVYYEDSTLTDTNAIRIVTRWVHFGIRPDKIRQWDEAYNEQGNSWRDSVHYVACIPVNGRQFIHKGMAKFKIVPYKSNIQFMAKYPDAGSWLFLMVIFCGFCFIAIPACIYIMKQVQALFLPEERPNQKGYWVSTGIVAGSLLFFLAVLFNTFGDEAPIKDLYFMRTLGAFLWFANALGCISGAFCLAGFIHSASMLVFFADKLKTQTTKVKQQREEVKKTMAFQQATSGLTATPAELKAKECSDEEEAKHKEYADQFRRLLGFFHRYFILSAILLSLVVLCSGALYNAANSMSFLQLLKVNWGYSPAGEDAVYLFGGIFTAILLLVYLPAKMQFGDVQLQLPHEEGEHDDDDSKWYGFLEQPFSWLRGGLIAASPFLSGLVQSLLGLLMKH